MNLSLRLAFLLLALHSAVAAAEPQWLEWTALPLIPDREGFAAPFAGVHEGSLMVAGGANFPEAKPWEGGTKKWYDTVFVLDQPQGDWRAAGRLPRPGGYGVSVSTPEGLICIGGSDAARHHSEVYRLRLRGEGIEIEGLPPLPKPCANFTGALLGRVIFVAGGLETPDATETLRTFWSLDLDHIDAGWQELEPWPGKARMLASAGVLDGVFYLVGGTALKAGADGKAERVWLQDAYAFEPGEGWRRIADPPQVSVAAPSPMAAIGSSRLLLIGGDDGRQITVPPTEHRGFPDTLFAYHSITDTWTRAGTAPAALVTTPTVIWGDRIVIPGGEIKPGIRSNEVWSGRILSTPAPAR